MNNFSATTIASWESRNWRHRDKAALWCRNYGLKPVLRNMYAGKLYAKERFDLEEEFKALFAKKTDKFFIGAFCRSCSKDAIFGDKAGTSENAFSDEAAFELIQIGKDEVKSPKIQ